ncbi:unnamed protein product [Rhodiola kirilowii]
MGKVKELKRAKCGKTRSNGKASDDSDEDYRVEEDEDYVVEEDAEKFLFDEEEDEDDEKEEQYCSDSFDNDDKSEERNEDSEEEVKMSKTARPKHKRSSLIRKELGIRAYNNRRNARGMHEELAEVTAPKRKRSRLGQTKLHTKASNNRRTGHRKIDDEDYNVDIEENDDEDQKEKFEVSEEEEDVNEVTRSTNRSCLDQKKWRTNNRRSGHGEIDDDDYCIDEEEEEDDDEEFTPDESFSLEEEFDEEELVVKKTKRNNKVSRRTFRKKSSVSRNKSKKTVRVADRKAGKKRKRRSTLRRKLGTGVDEDGDDYDDGEFINKRTRRGRTEKKPPYGKRKFTVQSDSDFVDSGPSEAEFTISEEEREQVREASNICRDLTVSLRSSCSNKIHDSESFARKKPFVTKGKKKIQEVKNEVIKQMCGICLSKEGKNTVRGTLNCCSHFFCFTCILEWSKVESRCPLCKQRFLTISKPAKANTGIDLRDVVLQIPERDQVYQPSEEEIRGFLDPYENVICTECREGGDDELMLLCDLCDSPSHTYCVGLGREVPEGNWYCEGCRPVSLGASNNQASDSLTGQRNLFHRLSSFDGIRDDLDGSLSTPFPHGYGSFPSPRYVNGGIQAPSPSPRSGTGVVTVSGRRQIHRHIRSMFSSHRTRQAAEALFDISAGYSQANQSHGMQRTPPPTRTPGIGSSYYSHLIDESHDTPTPQNMQFLPVRPSHLEAQMVIDSTSMPSDNYLQGTLRPSYISILHNDQSSQLSNMPIVGSDYHLSSSTLGEGSNFFIEEQVKPLVQNYLTSMSITSSLDASTVEDIARKSTNTILAACGYQHHPTEVFPMPHQPLCTHIEDPVMHTSPMKGHCNSCYTNFVKEVVKTIMNSRLPPFLHIRN